MEYFFIKLIHRYAIQSADEVIQSAFINLIHSISASVGYLPYMGSNFYQSSKLIKFRVPKLSILQIVL